MSSLRRNFPRRPHEVACGVMIAVVVFMLVVDRANKGVGAARGGLSLLHSGTTREEDYQPLHTAEPLLKSPVDAIVVPGGGSQRGPSARSLPVSVRRRLDLAIVRWYEHQEKFPSSPLPKILVLSAGTVHRPNYVNRGGWPISEASSGAQYILEVTEDDLRRPIPRELIFQEGVSLDTIGNAYFLRVIHTDPAEWRSLHVITSGYHLERTQAIFEFVFSALPTGVAPGDEARAKERADDYRLSFEASTDKDVPLADLSVRVERETNSLRSFRSLLEKEFGVDVRGGTAGDVTPVGIPDATRRARISLGRIHRWLFTKHDAYRTVRGAADRPPVDPKLLNTY